MAGFRWPLLQCILAFLMVAVSHVCREPDSEVAADERLKRKFIFFGGEGGGLGNLLIFFPSVYYFAALTGREIVIADNSLLGEICRVMICGYPLLSTMKDAYPEIFTEEAVRSVRGLKAFDFRVSVEAASGGGAGAGSLSSLAPIVRGDGYKYSSEWWVGVGNGTAECIRRVTGCEVLEDVACGDRRALQSLLVGPFRSRFTAEEEKRVVGVPRHIKHGIMSLRHSLSPRFEVAVHLRTQFKHFEWLVGPGDDKWADAQLELYTWLNSTDRDKGDAVFKLVADKLIDVVNADLQVRYLPEGNSAPSVAPVPEATATPTQVSSIEALESTASDVGVASTSGSVPNYKLLYEETQRKIAALKALAASKAGERPSTSGPTTSDTASFPSTPDVGSPLQLVSPSKSSAPDPMDFKRLYEDTMKQIAEIKATKSKNSAISAVEAAPGGIVQSVIDKVLSVRSKILGPGQKIIYPALPIESAPSRNFTVTPAVSVDSSPLISSTVQSKANDIAELSFDLEPFKAVSPYQLGTLLYSQHQQKQPSAPVQKRRLRSSPPGEEQVLYVYVSSDNSVVKEAFCKYLDDRALKFQITDASGNILHFRLQMMRVVNEGSYIAHGKNIANLKGSTNNTGVVDLALDWYSLSLANHILSWRRDTDLISTFAQSAQRLSGNLESTQISPVDAATGLRNKNYHGIGHGKGSRGYNLYFVRGNPRWRDYW